MASKITKAERVKRLRALLTKAVDNHLKEGGKLTSGMFYGDNNTCCPIRCATGDPEKIDLLYEEALSKKLKFNFSEEDMWAFIHGFDAYNSSKYSKDLFFKLGASIRKKYIEQLNGGSDGYQTHQG